MATADAAVIVHEEPIPFRHMPETEAYWVLEERMKLKKRRNSGRGRRGRRRSRSRTARVPDAPEVIAAKREARRLKREAAEAVAPAEEEKTGS